MKKLKIALTTAGCLLLITSFTSNACTTKPGTAKRTPNGNGTETVTCPGGRSCYKVDCSGHQGQILIYKNGNPFDPGVRWYDVVKSTAPIETPLPDPTLKITVRPTDDITSLPTHSE